VRRGYFSRADAPLGDLAFVDHDLLVGHPGPPDVLEGLVRPIDADRDGILEALL
jgi:hypothetical protein